MKEEIRIFFTGGATGGHLYPLIVVKKELEKIAQEKNLNLKFFYLGVQPIDPQILIKEKIQVFIIPSSKLRKYFSLKNLIDLLKFPLNFFSALFKLFQYMPDVVFSKGGPGSLGVVLSAWLLRIPVVIHDSDTIPGLTNKISSFFAKKVAISWEVSRKHFPSSKVVFTGQPVDTELINTSVFPSDYQRFNLDFQKNIILVIGGSQGSRFLNDLIVESLYDLLSLGEVVHITGKDHYQETYLYAEGKIYSQDLDKLKNYHPFPFLSHEDLTILMKISDLIISRAGAGSIFEISALGKPSILIPIEEKVAGEHQLRNAYEYHKYGACFVLEEKNATPQILITLVEEVLKKEEIKKQMSQSALEFAKLSAGQKIAELIISLTNKK